MDEKEARSIFGLESNFSLSGLKKLFRDRAKLAHPDVGGTEKEFQDLSAAFETLSKFATREDGVEEASTTVDGLSLSELGKGYPLSVSAVTCEGCEGRGYKGYTTVMETRPEPCPACRGTALFSYPCKRCQGTGKYKHPNTGKVLGDCNGCKGTGRFVPKADPRKYNVFMLGLRRHPDGVSYAHECKECWGSGTVEVPVGSRVAYVKCGQCQGIGEIRVWNPVLSRGFLAARSSKEEG